MRWATVDRALCAVTDALLPRSEGLNLPITADVVADISEFSPHLGRATRVGLLGYLLAVEYCIPSAYGHRTRFSRLDRHTRQHILRRCLHSRSPLVRDLTRAMNALVVAHFYDDRRVRAHLGYAIEAHVRRVNTPTGEPSADSSG